MTASRGAVRLALALLVAGSVFVIVGATLSSPTDAATVAGEQSLENASRTTVAPPAEGVTVIATDSNVWLSDEGDGPRANAELVAFEPDGSVLYYNDTYDRYWDVDPSPVGERVVLYTASIHLNGSVCGATTACTRNVVERVDLDTGEVTRLYDRITPFKHSTRWHDVDRLDESRVVIADIHQDRVIVVNTTTDLVEWEWAASSAFEPESGGPYPRDWTHLNDVEVLDDGRFMVSLRNHDQVVFIDPDSGIQRNWTLGEDDRHEVLFEQHNPDFIPAERGGPAVLVADSENGRVVEYQRANGSWERTWTWRDGQLKWPRDADRLPNGHTLVTDSNGNRVLEVDRSGEVVWSVDIAFPYEAERLGTGDESAGGESAVRANLTGRNATEPENGTTGEDTDTAGLFGGGAVPIDGRQLNAVRYVMPIGMGLLEAGAAVVGVAAAVSWAGLEVYWSRWAVTFRSPVRLRRD